MVSCKPLMPSANTGSVSSSSGSRRTGPAHLSRFTRLPHGGQASLESRPGIHHSYPSCPLARSGTGSSRLGRSLSPDHGTLEKARCHHHEHVAMVLGTGCQIPARTRRSPCVRPAAPRGARLQLLKHFDHRRSPGWAMGAVGRRSSQSRPAHCMSRIGCRPTARYVKRPISCIVQVP